IRDPLVTGVQTCALPISDFVNDIGREFGRQPSPTNGRSAGQEIVYVARRDERDVAPDRALERRHRLARVDRVLERAPTQRRPEEDRQSAVEVKRGDVDAG